MSKIAICVAHSFTHYQNEFAESLFEMAVNFYGWSREEGRKDILEFHKSNGYSVDVMRNMAVKEALDGGADYIVMFDTDMSFPADTLIWMLEDMEDNEDLGVEAITGINTSKRPPYMPLIYKTYKVQENGKGRFSSLGVFPLKKLFQVAGTGCASIMVKREVFERMTWPYFKFPDNHSKKAEGILKAVSEAVGDKDLYNYEYIGLGEDLYFCAKAQPFMLCDPRIQPNHWAMRPGNVKKYIWYNNLERTEEGFDATKLQLNKIEQEQNETQ